jgi:hypothetical protein
MMLGMTWPKTPAALSQASEPAVHAPALAEARGIDPGGFDVVVLPVASEGALEGSGGGNDLTGGAGVPQTWTSTG